MGWSYKSDGRSPPLMALPDWPDPAGWSGLTWTLHAVGALYVLGFIVFYFRFRRGERRAVQEGGEAILRYNGSLRGFPNAFYAKMLGRRRLEVKPPATGTGGPAEGRAPPGA